MSPSYHTENTITEQDILIQEPSLSARTTMWNKVGVAALVGTAFVVGCNSYGHSTIHTPTTDIETFLSSMSDLSVVDVDGALSCVYDGRCLYRHPKGIPCCSGGVANKRRVCAEDAPCYYIYCCDQA